MLRALSWSQCHASLSYSYFQHYASAVFPVILPSHSLLLMRSNTSSATASRHVLVERITVAQRSFVPVASVVSGRWRVMHTDAVWTSPKVIIYAQPDLLGRAGINFMKMQKGTQAVMHKCTYACTHTLSWPTAWLSPTVPASVVWGQGTAKPPQSLHTNVSMEMLKRLAHYALVWTCECVCICVSHDESSSNTAC